MRLQVTSKRLATVQVRARSGIGEGGSCKRSPSCSPRVSTAAIRCSAIWRRVSSTTPYTRIPVWRRIAWIRATIARRAIHLRALTSTKPIHAISLVATRQFLDDRSEFLLEDFNALLHNLVRLQATDSLNIKEETMRHCIEVEGLAILGNTIDTSIFAVNGPACQPSA